MKAKKMEKKMRILIVTHYFLPHKGGIEFVAYNQAKELVKKGHKVTIVSSKIGNEPEEEIMDGIKIRRVKAWNWFEKKMGVPYPVFGLNLLKIMLEEVKEVDLVHIHDLFYLPSFAGALASRKLNKPLILMQHVKTVKHSKWFVNFVQWFVKNTYGNYIVNKADKIFICNEGVGDWLNQKNKIKFIENSVDINLFKPIKNQKEKLKLRKKYNLPINKPVIIFVGRFVEVKGFDKLFEARDKDYFILLVGSGIVPEYMKKNKNTRFIESVPQEKLKELYKLSDIFCLPSSNEGFPLTILEAMASGLPIIASDLPVYRKHLDYKKIILINSTPENIKISIKNLLSDKKKLNEMKEYSREEAIKKFSWEKNAKKVLKIYKQAIKQYKNDPKK